ncbi:MAG TPA: hypothetical protein VJ547_02680 [Candidatus Thermoplasmatota archaeon]|nr:hypothetical protein [Candidatus Thermoplasmatota archaeon]
MTETSLRDFIHRVLDRDPVSIPEDFGTRLMFQKVLYLAQEAGLLRGPRYDFNLYFYGPYSPEWARIGYAVAEGTNPVLDVSDDLSVLDCLIQERNETAWLVALATLHWYVVHLGLDADGAREKAAANGKYSLVKRFDEAWAALESVNWLQGTQA